MKVTIYELPALNFKRKSFYGKAQVYVSEDGTRTLYSYGTPIIRKSADGTLSRLWDGWSLTTGRHIAEFCGISKAAWDKMEIVSD